MRRLILASAVLGAGCGPVASAPEPQVPVVQVITVSSAPPADAAPITSGPFGVGQVWTGTYYCPQGDTDLRLIVLEAHDYKVRALFDFHHQPSGAKGMYVIDGSLDPRSGKVHFRPEAWIARPDGYVMVGMAGRISPDAEGMSGRITNDLCGEFEVRLQAP